MKDEFDINVVYPEGAPGSDKAQEAGCVCPVMDNGYGRGYMGVAGRYVINAMCKIHGQERIWDTPSEYGQDTL
jgi:hypothetical protein